MRCKFLENTPPSSLKLQRHQMHGCPPSQTKFPTSILIQIDFNRVVLDFNSDCDKTTTVNVRRLIGRSQFFNMATFRVLFAIAAILSLPTTVGSTCYSRTLYARTYSQQISVSSPPNYEYCSFYIRPSSYYSSSYFLEISWSSTFDVKGNMPYCIEDAVEVFLTR